jgi:hypothetical protein
LLTGERDQNTPFSMHLKPFEALDGNVERFLASLRFEQREKLDQLRIDIGTFE